MNSQLNAYINFSDNRSREAMAFYQSVFGGEVDIKTFGDFKVADAPADGVMHSALSVDGKPLLMASDNTGAVDGAPGFAGFSLSLTGSDAEELRGYYEKLSAGGNVMVALSKQMWGDEFGMFTDKFGVTWMVNITAAS